MFPTDERDERQPATVPAGLVLAGIGRRTGGFVIDQLLTAIPVALGLLALGYRAGDDLTDDAVLAINIALAVSRVVHDTVLIACFGRTVGKIATGTRVVRQRDGGRVGWLASGQRAIVPVLFNGVPEVGVFYTGLVYVTAMLGPLRQGLHDRAAGTIVIRNGARAIAA